MQANLNSLEGRWHLFWSCNFCIEKQLFDTVGGFDEQFVGWGFEDVELGYRLCQRGVSIELINNAVWHFMDGNPITEAKYQDWLKNIQVFYEKYKDVRILQQFEFENVFFSSLKLDERLAIKPKNWLECYTNFERKLCYLKSHPLS